MHDKVRVLQLALKGLHAEREKIEEEIRAIEKHLDSKGKPLGSGGNRKRLSEEGRRAISLAMKKRWQSYRRLRKK